MREAEEKNDSENGLKAREINSVEGTKLLLLRRGYCRRQRGHRRRYRRRKRCHGSLISSCRQIIRMYYGRYRNLTRPPMVELCRTSVIIAGWIEAIMVC